jgi:hypothetical protein
VLEPLPSMCEALSSFSTPKKWGLGVMGFAYNPSTQVVKAGESRVQGQPGLYSETTFWEKKGKLRSTLKDCGKDCRTCY